MRPLLASEGWEASLGREQPGKWSGGNLHPHWQIRPLCGRVPEPSPGLTLRTASPIHPAAPGSARGGPPTQTRVRLSLLPNPTLAAPRMAEFGAGGAGRREEDRRARKEGTKLLKALGMGSLLKGGKSKEKLRREKERRRAEEQARAAAEARTRQSAAREVAARRAV